MHKSLQTALAPLSGMLGTECGQVDYPGNAPSAWGAHREVDSRGKGSLPRGGALSCLANAGRGWQSPIRLSSAPLRSVRRLSGFAHQ
jgi:hypothetical protein